MIWHEYNGIVGSNEQPLQRVALQDLEAGTNNMVSCFIIYNILYDIIGSNEQLLRRVGSSPGSLKLGRFLPYILLE